jgi:hypothetical protein
MTFYRSRITLTVLSNRPVDGMELGAIIYECEEGDMVLGDVSLDTQSLTREQMNTELVEAGSDPSFFDEELEPA